MAVLPLSRREAIRRILVATALAGPMRGLVAFGGETPIIGYDPNLLEKKIPWPRLLTDAEKRAVTALADIILPADEFGPAASALGVPDFIDEWVSAPYDSQVKDRKIIREGLAWLDKEAQRRFTKDFADSAPAQQTEILADIGKEGTDAHKQGKTFFLLFRDRAAGGYFTTPEGWKAIGYTGNVPQMEFAGPTPEALAHAGLA